MADSTSSSVAIASSVVVVRNTRDQGPGSLRQAIAQAQSGDVIRFAPSLRGQTIVLTRGQLEITRHLTLDGTQAPGLALSGNRRSRVLRIGDNTTVTIRNLTITQGRASGNDEASGSGGGIQTGSGSTLTLIDSRLVNNMAGFGGGLYAGFQSRTVVINSLFRGNDGSRAVAERGGGAIATKSDSVLIVRGSSFIGNRGTNGGAINNLLSSLLVENSVFLNNDSTPGGTQSGTSGYGGAIYTDGANASGPGFTPGSQGGTITIRNSRFEGNRGAGQGGGLFLFAYPPDRVIVEDSYIVRNTVIRKAGGDALGGGLRHGNAALILRNTTFANNRSFSQGGGLWIGEASPVTIVNSTFARNRADDGQGGGLGGAIAFANGNYPSLLLNTTVAYNAAGFQGGAFWSGNQPITLTNSIVAFNTATNPWNTKLQTGQSLRDGGNNIEFPGPQTTDPQDVKVVAGSRVINPQLGSLRFNGGFAPTYGLLANSPALNRAGVNTAPNVDQRRLSRGSDPDIGALERLVGRLAFRGSDQADFLVGSLGGDRLIGQGGNDFLLGYAGADEITTGAGADIVVYAGNTQASAFSGSRLGAVDRLLDFNVRAGDRLLLDVNNDLVSDRPVRLFNAGAVAGRTLADAVRAAYQDKNQQSPGDQALGINEAVWLGWRNQLYLAVNDGRAGFQANRDLLINGTGLVWPLGDAQAGTLTVGDYFV